MAQGDLTTTSGSAPADGRAADDDRPFDDVAEARRRKRPGQWIAGALLVVLVAQFVNFLVTNDNLDWPTVGKYLFDDQVLSGVATTLKTWAMVVVLATVLGTAVCLFRMSSFALARWVATAYIAIFLAIPGIVQLIFWFNLAFLLPDLSIGIPFGPTLHSWETNSVIDPFAAAVLGLTIVESAYLAEVIRGGLLSVPSGQYHAARSVGFNGRTTFFRVVLPQALRAILPGWGTKLITILKATSLVSIIGQTDLLGSVRIIYNQNFKTVPLLLVAVIWYLALVTVLTLVRDALERRFSRGYRQVSSKKPRGADTSSLALADGATV